MLSLATKERMKQAKEVSRRVGCTGMSLLQRQMGIGYMTASHLLDALLAEGFCVRVERTSKFQVTPKREAK